MSNTYIQRYITVIIGIGQGQFGDIAPPPSKIYTLSDHRISADINEFGGQTMGQGNVKIYGISLQLMNQLISIGPIQQQVRGKNSIQILAGTDPNALSLVYAGTIQTAFADFNQSPDVALEVVAQSSLIAAMKPVPAYSSPLNTPVTVEQIMQTLATKGNLAWGGNSGVTASFTNVTYNGSALDQINACAAAAGIDYNIFNFALFIKTKNNSYPQPSIPVISPDAGMVGYPLVSDQFLEIRSLFIPALRLGQTVQVAGSLIAGANGKWIVNRIQHELESRMPNGKWFTSITAGRSSFETTPTS